MSVSLIDPPPPTPMMPPCGPTSAEVAASVIERLPETIELVSVIGPPAEIAALKPCGSP